MPVKKGTKIAPEIVAKQREAREQRRAKFGPTVNRRSEELPSGTASEGFDYSVGPGYRRYGFRPLWEE